MKYIIELETNHGVFKAVEPDKPIEAPVTLIFDSREKAEEYKNLCWPEGRVVESEDH